MEKKAVSPAQKKAYKKYISGTDEIRVRAPKGTKQTITEYLIQSGETMQEFVLRATLETMENDRLKKEQYDRLCAYKEAFARMKERKSTAKDNEKSITNEESLSEMTGDEIIRNMIMDDYTLTDILRVATDYTEEKVRKIAESISDEEYKMFTKKKGRRNTPATMMWNLYLDDIRDEEREAANEEIQARQEQQNDSE